ncbi:MAG: aminopeptidase P family protein [Ignavibacteria bacterium]|nr:aminopeptidase P family protein [Ignavibacteria bacterium]
MFSSKTYIQRRNILRKKMKSGLLLIPGNVEIPMNYPANTYRFRQDSTFLYYFGNDVPGLFGIIDADNNEDMLFGNDFEVDDIIWMGNQPTIKALGGKSGIRKTGNLNKVQEIIKDAINKGRVIHFLPQYSAENKIMFSKLLGIKAEAVNDYKSVPFIKAVVSQRSVKSNEEIREIEKALDISYEMHTYAMFTARPGIYEREISGTIDGFTYSMGKGNSFPTILSVHGETLHNHHHGNLMKSGNLLVNDSGAESLEHYASDITRTFPVNGKFTQKQKEIYQVVLDSQLAAIDTMKPGVKYRDVHLLAAKVITAGLKNLGLMRGDVKEAVSNGAHALFFPHGLGHMLGLDVHDMEGLGENYVGYNDKIKRSTQFGLAYLRFAKELEPGFVLTVEPGIYFIPQLIDLWKSEKKHTEFINYSKVEKYKDFGGIRIEDDVLIIQNGHRVLGKAIPKLVHDVEEICT